MRTNILVIKLGALGDFVQAVMVFAYLKRKFRGSVLLVYAQNDRPYKAYLVNLCPISTTRRSPRGREFPWTG